MKVIHLNRSSKATRWLDVKQQLWWSPGQCSSCRGAEVPVLASGTCWQRSGPACGSDQKFFPGNSCCQKAATKAAFAGLSVWRPLVKQLAQMWLDSHFALMKIKVIALVFIAIVMCLHNINIWLVSIIGKASMWLWSEVEDSFSDKMLHRVT